MNVVNAGMQLFDLCAQPVRVAATNGVLAVKQSIRIHSGFVSVPSMA